MLIRTILICCIAWLSADAVAQAIVWEREVPLSSHSRMIRDTSSNIYLATRETNLIRHYLRVQKFNALGTVIWDRPVDVGSALSESISIMAITASATHVYVVFQLKQFAPPHTVATFVRRFWMSDGTSEVYQAPAGFEGTGIDFNASKLVLVGKSAMSRATFQFLNPSTLGLEQNIEWLDAVSFTTDVVVDSSGFAYGTAALSDGRVNVARAQDTGDVSWNSTIDTAYNGEQIARLVVDTSSSRVYGLGRGIFQVAPFDFDCLLYVLNSGTGAQLNAFTLAATSDHEYPDDLIVVPGNGAVASVFRLGSTMRLVRVFTGGAGWTSMDLSAQPNGYRRLARDADGNVVMGLLQQSGSVNLFVRYDVTTGAKVGQIVLPLASSANLDQVVTDPAGNIYTNQNWAASVVLRRIQAARLEYSANNVSGGTTVTGTVQTPNLAETDQTWTLTSSSPSVAAVPANVVVSAGDSSAGFPITTNPVTVNTNVSIAARHAGFIVQRTLTLVAPLISSVGVAPNVVVGGVSPSGTVALTGQAPVGGKVVNLLSNKPLVASVPASVTVLAGNSTAGFTVTTFGVNANQGVVLTATTGATSKTVFFAVNAPSLTTISVTPTAIQGGVTGTLTLSINGIAPTGGFSIVLFSGAPGIVFLPASASVSAGMTTRDVSMPTATVTSSTNVLIFATRSGIYKTTTLTVTP